MALTIHQVAVGGFDKNFSYIIADTDTRQAFIVDPSGEFSNVTELIVANSYAVVGILLTHTHHDHWDQLSATTELYPVPTYVYETGVPVLKGSQQLEPLHDGTELALGSKHITVIHTPGHIDDAVCFYINASEATENVPKVITGDTLFVGGCGRTTELRVKDLYESLRELANLPDETVVFPGHDYGDTPTSTIGREKVTNRFYRAKNFNEFKRLRIG